MTTYYNTIKLALLFVLLLGVSCTSDDLGSNPGIIGKKAEIKATIGNPVETKATMRSDDKISYSQFETSDEIGFYSEGGLAATNTKLTYTTGSFLLDALQWTDGDAEDVFAYYPYTADEANIDIWRLNANGLPNGFNDILTAENSKVTQGTLVELTFQHHFAMLIIQRGAGFENPVTGNENISVNLNESVDKTASIKGRKSIELKKNETDGVKTLSTYKGNQYNTKDSWYVIVPIGNFAGGGKAEVESITIHNNNGDEMTIPYSRKNLASNTKYVVTVQLRNDVAVIEPEEIIRWTDEDVDIESLPGINDEEGFMKWLAAYNGSSTGELGNYGSYDNVNNEWTFRLLKDIEIKTWNDGLNNAAVITNFSDIFDGQGHTISGIKLIGNAANTGFFGTLSGKVQNLKLEDINVEGTTEIGAIAGFNTGTITNCQVKGFSVVVGTNNVGGLVGNNTGTINGCTSSAIVAGPTSNSVGLLVGSGLEGTANISTGAIVKK